MASTTTIQRQVCNHLANHSRRACMPAIFSHTPNYHSNHQLYLRPPSTVSSLSNFTSIPSRFEQSSTPAPTTPNGSPFVTREVDQVLLSREQAEGVGARVRRSIGRPELRNFDPFLMLDEFNVNSKGGFPDHPHRGMETVTYMFPHSTGGFEHEDFMGSRGTLKPGYLQWMTAGRGIVHSEMPATGLEGKTAHGLQLWISLAKKDKMCEPAYQELPPEKVPKVKKDGIEAHVIAGSALGTDSPIYTKVPMHYIHFFLDAHKTLHQPIPDGYNSFLYTISGDVSIGTPNPNKLIGPHNTVTLTRTSGQNGITVTTYDKPASFVFLAGKILNEPIVQHGPFVMNSREEIMEAFRDYSEGKNGFERAPGWRSEIGRPITDHM